MDIFNNAQKAWLLLEDGTLYEGYGLGCAEDTVGELVFNTSVVGYQEILTDPANANNIVVETFPLTGNYGVNREHDLHDSITAKGWVVREWCAQPSNFRCEGRIDEYLEQKKISAIFDLDTRRHHQKAARRRGAECADYQKRPDRQYRPADRAAEKPSETHAGMGRLQGNLHL